MDWGDVSINKHFYPVYPMDKRKTFWISQPKKEPIFSQSNNKDQEDVDQSPYLMLEEL